MSKTGATGANDFMPEHKQTVTVHLFGGLGNQMFQYATAASIGARLGAEVVLDTTWFNLSNSKTTQRPYLLSNFPNLKARIASLDELRRAHFLSPNVGNGLSQRLKRLANSLTSYTQMAGILLEPHNDYWPVVNEISRGPLYLDGYFQHEEYFSDIRADLIRQFSLNHLSSPRVEMYKSAIEASQNSISLHIRLGDYVKGPTQLGTCTSQYYRNGLDALKDRFPDSRVFIFCDEPSRISLDAYPDYFDYTVLGSADYDTSCEDMYLMSLCNHHIIANSTYSWWGAWLGETADSLVIAPDTWFPGNAANTLTPVPARWLSLPTK